MKQLSFLLILICSVSYADDYSLSYDGVNDFVEMEDAPALNLLEGDFSISIWAKAETWADGNMFMSKKQNGGNLWQFNLNGGTGAVTFLGKVGGVPEISLSSEPDILTEAETNAWLNIILAIDRTLLDTAYIYINGVASDSVLIDTLTDASLLNTGKLRFGRKNNGYYTGKLDEIAFWNSAVTSTEAAAIYAEGNVLDVSEDGGNYVSSAALQGYWKFNEGSGTSTQDHSPHGNDGMLVGDPVWDEDSPVAAVVGAPSADFSATPTNGDAPLSVQFSDLSTPGNNPIASHEWNFGDGTSSDEASPLHVYQDVGHFSVSLTVTDDQGLQSTKLQADLILSGLGQHLSNQSFETWNDTMPDYWEFDKDTAVTASIEESLVHWGTRSVRIDQTITNARLLSQQDIPVVPGDDYKFSAWFVDNDSALVGRILVRWENADHGRIGGDLESGITANEEGWQYISTGFVTAPDSAAFCDFKIRTLDVNASWDGDGTIYVDDASMIGPGGVVSIDPVRQSPRNFNLSQNFPNPFNPSTSIPFELANDQHISLDLFDIKGRWVTSVASGVYSAGSHLVQFDGTNLPAGLYLYRLESEAVTQVKKMTLVK
ncbi:MAG: PKD domain-containing protein [FCB group bacterium]|nr:PKD domain-containing protein [FCB group bacterium]MBL7120390.1 PKD domain-containing protein [Candidatus Neomarinimicrobiota bacterium]